MIDTTVFQNKTAVYYTLGCKLNFSETSTIDVQRRKQHRRENRDDRNNDQKFDQGESTLFHVSFLRHIIINK